MQVIPTMGFPGKSVSFFSYSAENPKEERASDDAITQRFETGCFLCPAKGPVQPVADPCHIACTAMPALICSGLASWLPPFEVFSTFFTPWRFPCSNELTIIHYRLIGLYLIRLGFAPSSPRRFRLSASYSW
jgi:hypothetical protein